MKTIIFTTTIFAVMGVFVLAAVLLGSNNSASNYDSSNLMAPNTRPTSHSFIEDELAYRLMAPNTRPTSHSFIEDDLA